MSDPVQVTTLGLLLGRLERLNEQFVAELCAQFETTPAELRVLALLRLGPQDGPASPSTIAQRIVQTSGGLTATLNRLERAGLTTRVVDPADGRGRLVELTEHGRDFADRSLDALAERYDGLFAEVDVADALQAVRSLIDVFERRTDRHPTGDWTAPVQAAGSTA